MKLLLTTLLLLSIAVGPKNEEAENNDPTVIAHEIFESPAAFHFGESLYLDIDKDGKNDFQFTTVMVNNEGEIHTKYLINALAENEILAVDGSAAISDDGSAIEAFGNEKWSGKSGEIIEQVINSAGEAWHGTWSGDRSQYVGIKLVKNDRAYLGWVSISIDQSQETAYVHGYALNRNPNGKIVAGEL